MVFLCAELGQGKRFFVHCLAEELILGQNTTFLRWSVQVLVLFAISIRAVEEEKSILRFFVASFVVSKDKRALSFLKQEKNE